MKKTDRHFTKIAALGSASVILLTQMIIPSGGMLQAAAATIPDVPFVLQVAPACGRKVVDIAGGNTSEGTNCQLYERNNSAAQAFRAVPAGNGYYYLLLASTTDKVLDVAGGKGYSGCNVQLYTANGTDAQLWKFENAGEEIAYYIKSKTGYYLDISGGSFEDGTNIQVYEGNQSLSQLFYFKKNYDANAAISYAYKYTDNNSKPSNPDYKNYDDNGGDCANFGSQCINAGGFVTSSDWNPVYADDHKLKHDNGQFNWVNAGGLEKYLQSLGYPISYIRSENDLNRIHKGDIVFLTDNSGTPYHTTICSVGGGNPKYCAHSVWRKDQDYSFSTFQNGIIVDMSFSGSANVSLPAPKSTGAAQQQAQTVQPTASNGQVCRTQAEAIAWSNARIAEKWGVDVDNYAGCQCVDLTKAYISYLTNGKTPNFYANAFEYASFNLPDGFTRTYSNPQPGDIVVWDKNKGSAGSYGHVGLVTGISGGTITVAETNYSGMMYVTVHDHPASTVTCYIRPSWVSSTPYEPSTNLQPGRYKVITTVGVNVRAQASQNSTLIAAASPGVTFVVTEVRNGYGYTPEIYSWVGNTQSNHAGWVLINADCCEYLGAADPVVTQQPAQNTDLRPGRYKVITPVGVNVRAQASQNSTLIAAASPNVTFVVTEVQNGYGYTPEIYSWVGNTQSNHAGWVLINADCCEYLGEAVNTTEKPAATTTKATTTTTTTTIKTTTTTTVPPVPKLAGDVNTDGAIDVSDAVALARFVAEDDVTISSVGRNNADADGNSAINSDDVITILRMIAHLPVNTWKLDDGKTSANSIKSEYWEYDIVSKKTSGTPTMQGWKLVSTGWKQTGTGTYLYADFPSGFSQSDARYQAIGKSAGKNTESETAKRLYGSAAVKEYIYWHWSYPMAEKCSENDRFIGEYNGDITPAGTCTVWEAFTSAENVTPSDKSGKACKLIGHSDGYSFWWFKLPVYQQSYTDYQKQYTFEKTEHFKSDKAPAANQNAVNIRHYVLTESA